MTLSQTYISRKQLLVDNLVAKGVTGYTVNDGLTTLINAVLEIQGGGSTRTLTLTSDKDILSYADSESATLTATLLEDGEPVPNVSVEFWNGSSSLGTAVTNSSGVAEKVYSSSGSGDVSLSASVGTLVSKTYSIQDTFKYDNASVDNCNNYITSFVSGVTFTHDGSNSRYIVQKTNSGSAYDSYLLVKDLSVDSPLEMSVDAMTLSSSSGYQVECGLLVKDNNTQLYGGFYAIPSDKKLTLANTPRSRVSNGSVGLSNNVWYHLVFTVTSSTVKIEIYNGETLIDTITHSNSYLSSNMNVGLAVPLNNIGQLYFKNLKIKPL